MACRALGEDHRMSAGEVVGKLIGRIGHSEMESYSLPPFQPFPLSSGARTPGFLRHPPVDPFEQIAELRRRDHHRAVGGGRPDKTPSFELLREQTSTLAVVPD